MREVNDDDNNVCMYDAKEGCGGCDATPLGPCPDAVPLHGTVIMSKRHHWTDDGYMTHDTR